VSARLVVYLVDDERLALARLSRMLEETDRVEVAGAETDPEAALAFLRDRRVDALFLDIHMPGIGGFELLDRLDDPPPVVFTTAHDEYALRAFEVFSVDYLLKPVEAAHLARALDKLSLFAGRPPDLRALLDALAASRRPARLASRVGDRVHFVEVDRVSHFYASDKLTYASADGKSFVVDQTIAQLEATLDPSRFVRVHRSALVNVEFVDEVHAGFAGRLTVRLKDARRTELKVARDRARAFRERLGF
jgi:two-component system LytT family response regulator